MYWLRDFTDRALSRLSICPGITELAVDPTYSALHLDTIARFFPHLQHLRVAIPPHISGSLNALKQLISLEVTTLEFPETRWQELPEFGAQVLPFDSAETLSVLNFEAGLLDFDTFDLSPFRNLRHVGFRLSSIGDIIECLQRLDIYLETFDYWIEEVPDPLYTSLFSIPSLSRLKTLILRVEFDGDEPSDPDYVHADMDIVTAITENLQHVRHLVFVCVGIDVGRVQCLSRLWNLKSIQWDIESNRGILGEGSPKEAVAKAFESFEVKPKIRVDTYDYSGFYGPRSRWTYEQPHPGLNY
jgi:hypothetical protein